MNRKLWRVMGLLLAAALMLALFGCSDAQEPAAEDQPQTVQTTPAEDGRSPVEREMARVNRTLDELAAGAGLAPLSMDVNLKPIGALSEVETSASFENGVATFAYTDGDATVAYTVDLGSESVQTGLLEIHASRGGSEPITAVMNAGVGYETTAGKYLAPKKLAAEASVSMTGRFDKELGHLILDYEDTVEEHTLSKRYEFFLLGKSLAVQVTSPDVQGKGGYAAFDAGSATGMQMPRYTNTIYCEEVGITVLDDGSFLSAYVDKAKSFATRIASHPGSDTHSTFHGMTAYYEINSAGQTNPLHELFYVTMSDDFLDCAYLTNGQASAYKDVLDDLVIYDNWMFTNQYENRKSSYVDLAENYGLEDVLLVEHRWQRDTLDISNPAHYPASTYWGTAEEFRDYIDTVKDQLGWTLALHEDYWFINPSESNQYWNTEGVGDKIAQNADGSFRYGWQSSYANLSNMMAEYSKLESTMIEEDYDPGASFLDVNGGVDPSVLNQVTFNADCPTSRTLAQVVADNALLFQTVRDIYKGPVISEGAQGDRSFGSAYAGFLDSGSREITGCSACRIMPDYEIKHIRGKMANQGMGPPGRFQVGAGIDTYDFDKLNATCLAYGHAGFIGEVHYGTPLLRDELVKVYYLFRAIQPQYLKSSVQVEEISYFDGSGRQMDLNEAVRSDYDFHTSRLHIRYSSGLELYLNFAPEDWNVTINGHEYTLDKNGFAAENPSENFVEYSCLRDGVRVDYVSCDRYLYANPRGEMVDFGDGVVTDQTYIRTGGREITIKSAARLQSETISFTKLVGGENGANGLTFYYTDGKTLTPFTQRATGADAGWVHGSDGVLVYPVIVPADNYGVAGTSAKEYVVMGYKLEHTGVIDLYSWTALQGPKGEHGYNVKIALDTLDNVVSKYQIKGDTQTVIATNHSLEVRAGQELLIIYEPIVWKNNEWFGYITSLSYNAIYDDPDAEAAAQDEPEETTGEPEEPAAVTEGQEIRFTDLVSDENGANGLTFFYTADGKTLTAFTKPSEGDPGWVHEKGVLVYPVIARADNYGVAGSSDSEYVVMGYELPASGTIDLFTWTALQGPSGEHGYHVKIALGRPDNIVRSYDNIGDTQNIVHNTYTLEVRAGDMLYMIYEPTVWKEGEWFGYITSLTYTQILPE